MKNIKSTMTKRGVTMSLAINILYAVAVVDFALSFGCSLVVERMKHMHLLAKEIFKIGCLCCFNLLFYAVALQYNMQFLIVGIILTIAIGIYVKESFLKMKNVFNGQ